jgi:hypothetical protein
MSDNGPTAEVTLLVIPESQLVNPEATEMASRRLTDRLKEVQGVTVKRTKATSVPGSKGTAEVGTYLLKVATKPELAATLALILVKWARRAHAHTVELSFGGKKIKITAESAQTASELQVALASHLVTHEAAEP